jgi:hypothetical protein
MTSENYTKHIFFRKCLYKNAIVYIGFLKKGKFLYKARIEAIIYNNEGKVFSRLGDPNTGGYYFPGGSIEVKTFKETSIPILKLMSSIAYHESCEECRIIPKNIKYTDITKCYDYIGDRSKFSGLPTMIYDENGKELPEEQKLINGTFSFLFVMQFDKKYSGQISKRDKSPFEQDGAWYIYKDIKEKIAEEEKKAIERYVPNSMALGNESWRIIGKVF